MTMSRKKKRELSLSGAAAPRPPSAITIDRHQDRVFTPQETARFLGIGLRSVRRLVETGEGPERVQITVRRYGFRLSAIDRWLTGRTTPAATDAGSSS
jgi:predicted DNA-binding transcriptional regulator AlpA